MSEAIEHVPSGLPSLAMSDDQLVEMAIALRQHLLTETDPHKLIKARHANRLFADLLGEHRRSLRVQNEYVENTVRLERQVGAYLEEALKPGAPKKSQPRAFSVAESGISHVRCAEWQYLAAISENEFNATIERVKQEERHLTQGELVKLGHAIYRRLHPPKRDPVPPFRPAEEHLRAVAPAVPAVVPAAPEPAVEPEPLAAGDLEPGSWWTLGRHLLYCGPANDSRFIEMAEAVKPAFAFTVCEAGIWDHDWLIDLVTGVVAVAVPNGELQNFFLTADMPYRRMNAYPLIDRGGVRDQDWPPWLPVLLFSRLAEPVVRSKKEFQPIVLTREDRQRGGPQAPAGVILQLMLEFTGPGEMVLDPGAGSGSTLMAAQEIGRNCLAAEADPAQAFRIVSWWEQQTGKEATRAR